MSKYAPIDLLKLYAGKMEGFEDDFSDQQEGAIFNAHKAHHRLHSHEKWNNWLTRCYETNNMQQLIDVRYRLQVGMDDLVKKKMSNQKIAEMYVRWIGSIDKTARRLIKKMHPIPKDGGPQALAQKRKRDQEFENYLRKTSY